MLHVTYCIIHVVRIRILSSNSMRIFYFNFTVTFNRNKTCVSRQIGISVCRLENCNTAEEITERL
jgi:hypothetical protein